MGRVAKTPALLASHQGPRTMVNRSPSSGGHNPSLYTWRGRKGRRDNTNGMSVANVKNKPGILSFRSCLEENKTVPSIFLAILDLSERSSCISSTAHMQESRNNIQWVRRYTTLGHLSLHNIDHGLTADSFPTNRLENGSRVLSALSFLGGFCRVKSAVRSNDDINLLDTITILLLLLLL